MDEKELKDTIYQKAIRFIALRPRTEKELRDYLLRKAGEDKEHIALELLKVFKEEGVVDDMAFITWWVEQRSYFKPKGRRVLERELSAKGISRLTITTYFEDNTLDEESLAIDALKKKFRLFASLPAKKQYEKSIRFLLSRGFSWDVAKKAFEQIVTKE